MVKELGNKVMLWATFNEPGVYVFQSYIRGVWPPGKIGINRAGQVIKNILQAHVSTYQAIKELPGGADIKVGIVHSVTQFEPHNPNSLLERTAAKYMNHMFHDAITEFFATGNLNFYVPMLAHISYINTQGTKSLDFFGINYYSHVLIQADLFNRKFGQAFRDGEIKTDMPYCIYAEGLYRAIKDISERIAESQQIPIYITENGIADYKDDRRELYIKQYIYALYKALCDGYDVRGYFYWSFLDNFEWDHGYGQKFGLYEVDMQTQKRKLRQGSKAYVDILQKTYGD
jgi:beta-glucosidase